MDEPITAPVRRLATSGPTLTLGPQPLLMGIVNATPDSFSDAGVGQSLGDRVALAQAMLDAGADLIDVGGESNVSNRPPIGAAQETARVVPLIERLAGELGAIVSVDTFKPAVARAGVAAGARIVNDTSGLLDPGLADVCAQTGAALVLMHTRAVPKRKVQLTYDGRVFEDVLAFLHDRIELAQARGVAFEQLLLDPGPDFAKTPAQTIAVLRRLPELHALGRPLLLAVSRKDFVGALTGRPPRGRLAGTLAAIAHGVDAGAHVLRVHDVAAVADFLAVRAALGGQAQVDPGLRLVDELRWDQPPAGTPR
jgi:dihydropteroate synthase